MLYAVTGANGFIASHVVSKLVEQGHKVRATVRKPDDEAKLAHLKSLGAPVEIVVLADLTSAEEVAPALKGCDGLFHMAAVHPTYGFEETPEGADAIIALAVEGTKAVLKAAAAAGVKRVVLTSSLAAVECGNDTGVLTEATWSREEVYNSSTSTQWKTHHAYVKSKTLQERAALAAAAELGLDLRVIAPGNLCIGPILSTHINGTMTRVRDVVQGSNTLKGCADLGVVHVSDVAHAHVAAMTTDSASGRYIVAQSMVRLEDVFSALKELCPDRPVAPMTNMDYASGTPGKARAIESRTEAELGVQYVPLKQTLKEAVDSMVSKGFIQAAAA